MLRTKINLLGIIFTKNRLFELVTMTKETLYL